MANAAASKMRLVNQEVLKEKGATLVAFQDVWKKSHELQGSMEKGSPKLLTATMVFHEERDAASQAVVETTASAMKAGELLAEVLGSSNVEMAINCHVNMQLQILTEISIPYLSQVPFDNTS